MAAAVAMFDAGGGHGASAGATAESEGRYLHSHHRHPRGPAAAAAMVASSPFLSTIHSNLQAKLDVHAGALSVDATGAFAVLAGRKGLHLIDLEAPFAPAATLHHQTKWDVAVVKWNPHAPFKNFVASTSNHNTLIWNVASTLQTHGTSRGYASQQPLVATLRGHTRPVSDVAWAPTEPTLLATCSADAKTHLWDTRVPQRPVQTLHAFTTSAVQVEWHRVDATTLATAHEGEVRIWDTRGSDKTPAVLITAHMQKIHGIDWHPKRMDELLTCSEDKTVKFWNVAQPRVCQGSLTTGAPVWRARYTPVGDGVVTSFHRQDNALRLWSLSHSSVDTAAGGAITLDQVHAFVGHTDLVKSFEWRFNASGNHFQIVSWSKNQELCLWRLDSQFLEACGHIQSASVSPSTTADHGPADSSFDSMEPLDSAYRYSMRNDIVTKYDVSTLKNDIVPLVVPTAAVPLGASEYSLIQGDREEQNAALRAMLTFDDDLSKLGEQNDSDDDDDDDDEAHNRESMSAATRDKAVSFTGSEAVNVSAALPCPRVFGACFSGPNVLVVFDSRVALGQVRHTAATPPVAPVAPGKNGKSATTTPAMKKLPRTYEQLLEMRDSRFSKKKNKKPPVKLLGGSTSGIAGGAMELSSEWSSVPMEMMDASGYRGDDTRDHSMHGSRRGTSRGSGFFNLGGVTQDGGTEGEFAVHGGSEYLKAYFASSEFHLPVNHPDHRTSMPLSSSFQGLSLSPPRSAMAASSGLIRGPGGQLGSMLDLRAGAKRGIEQPSVSSLQLDLNLSVMLLDLSQLCGVSSVLTYGTQLAPSSTTQKSKGPNGPLDAGTRDLYAWMLKATESRRVSSRITSSRRARRGTGLSSPVLASQKVHPLSRILQSLLTSANNPPDHHHHHHHRHHDHHDHHDHHHHHDPKPTSSVSDVCAHNAQVALLAGRYDLQQVWSILELTTASNLQLPQQHQQLQQLQLQQQKNAAASADTSGVDALATAHPWRAHPFGQNLVNKMLSMYEEAGDLPTLASIVCALQPPVAQEEHTDDSFRSDRRPTEQSTHENAESHKNWNVSLSSMPSTATATTSAPSAKVVNSPFNRSRTSFNSLSQLLGGQAESADAAPPAMRSARRSSSHNEVPKLSQTAERVESPTIVGFKAGAKDWPVTVRGASSGSKGQHLSPGMSPAPPSWKGLDFEKIENPFKTWSSGSAMARADASPRPLTSDTFRPPSGSPSASILPPHRRRDSSMVDSDDESSLAGRILLQIDKRHDEEDHHVLSTHPLDELRYDGYKEAYAELLYRYGALNLRSDVLKSTATDTASSSGGEDEDGDDGLQFGVLCRSCQSVTNDLYCSSCRDFSIKCSICQLVVRGQSMYCMTCGHGGHEQHMREWFEDENACPTGCGCWCKQATAMALPPGSGRSMDQHAPAAFEGRLQSRSYSF